MKRHKAKMTLAAALLVAGLGTCWPTNHAPAVEQKSAVNQTVMIQEAGHAARACTVISTVTAADGSTTYTVKAKDNGELITVVEKAKPKGIEAKTTSTIAKVESAAPPLETPKVRETDPLLQLPADAKKKAIVANVNEASTTRVVPATKVAPMPVKEQRSLLSRIFGEKVTPAPTTAVAKPTTTTTTTVSVAVPAPKAQSPKGDVPPVVIEPAPVSIPVPQVGASKPVAKSKPVDANKPGFAVVGDPVPTSSTVMPQLPQRAVAMPTVPLMAVPNTLPRELQLQAMLREGVQPSVRELAAIELVSGSSARLPGVKSALMIAAKDDPAATVRACCLKCLVQVAPSDAAVRSVLESAKEDKDARVRNEANELLNSMKK